MVFSFLTSWRASEAWSGICTRGKSRDWCWRPSRITSRGIYPKQPTPAVTQAKERIFLNCPCFRPLALAAIPGPNGKLHDGSLRNKLLWDPASLSLLPLEREILEVREGDLFISQSLDPQQVPAHKGRSMAVCWKKRIECSFWTGGMMLDKAIADILDF